MRGVFAGVAAVALLAAPAAAEETAAAEPMAGLWRVTWTGTINATRNLRIETAREGFRGRYEGIANASVFEGRSLSARGRTLVWMTQTLDQGGEAYHSLFSGVLNGDVVQGTWYDVEGGRAEIVMRRVPGTGGGSAPVTGRPPAPGRGDLGSAVAIDGEPVVEAPEVKPVPEDKGKKDKGKKDKGRKGEKDKDEAAEAVAADTTPPAPAGPTCESVLIDKGHPAGLLGNCRGAEATCAVALLQAGHHPSHLSRCDAALPAGCLRAVIAKGHHPSLLSSCRGVDEACAVALIERGDHPSSLRNCRR